MAEQATAETFKTDGYAWERHGNDAVRPIGKGYSPRRWRGTDHGNGLSFLFETEWRDDVLVEQQFDHECRIALRALVGPPPWEIRSVQSETASVENITIETIRKIDARLYSLSNESESGFAELRGIAVRLVEERDQVKAAAVRERDALQAHTNELHKRLKTLNDEIILTTSERDSLHGKYLKMVEAERDNAKSNRDDALGANQPLEEQNARLVQELQDLERRLSGAHAQVFGLESCRQRLEIDLRIGKSRCEDAHAKIKHLEGLASEAELISGTGTRDETIEAVAKVMDAILGSSMAGVVIQCPHGEPMHDHGDGCPSCLPDHELAQAIAKDLSDQLGRQWIAMRADAFYPTVLAHIQKQSAARTTWAVKEQRDAARFAKEREPLIGRDPHEIAVAAASEMVEAMRNRSWFEPWDKIHAYAIEVIERHVVGSNEVEKQEVSERTRELVVCPAMNTWLKAVQDALAKLDAESSGFAESKARQTQRWAELDDRLRKLEAAQMSATDVAAVVHETCNMRNKIRRDRLSNAGYVFTPADCVSLQEITLENTES